MCGLVLDRFCDRAAVCAGDLNRRDTAVAHVFCEAAQEAGLRSLREKVGILQRRPDTRGLPYAASLDRPADACIIHGQDMIPEAWVFAVTSCLRQRPL